MKIRIDILRENPLNQKIYGDDDEKQFNELVAKIKKSGWIKAVLITNDYLIISGHRRVKAARLLGIEVVEYEVVTSDPDKQVEIFLNENAYRLKSNTQLLREAEMYFDIEQKKAHQRELAGVAPEVNLPQGRTTEIVAEKIGMSESSYKKGRKILNRIDEEVDPNIEWILECRTDQSIDAGSKLAEKPIGFIQQVIEKTGGDKDKIPSAISEVEQEEGKLKAHLPPGKYQVVYCDLTNNPSENLSKLPISEIGEADSVLFLWTTPFKLSMALRLLETWKYHYITCMVWYKDVFEISDKAEILTISTKGNPPMIQQAEESDGKTEKPELVREMISASYTGTKIELTFGDSDLDGWKMWS